MKLRPLQDRILVQRVEEETKTKAASLFRIPPKKNRLKGKSSRWATVKSAKTANVSPGIKKRRSGIVRQICRHRGEN